MASFEERAAVASTAVLAVTAVGADFIEPLRLAALLVALALFLGGAGAMLVAYGLAVARSRHDTIAVGGLFFLAGDVAPTAVRNRLRAALAAQVAIGVTTAAVRPFTSLAFGVLAPLAALGLTGVWAARHGRFPARATHSEQ